MALNEAQLNYVINLPVDKIVDLIVRGEIEFPAGLHKHRNHPKYKEIQTRVQNMPDPKVMAEYGQLAQMVERGESGTMLETRLRDFISKYRSLSSVSAEVEKARTWLADITAESERADWESVDRTSVNSLLGHRKRYPATVHEQEIDRMVWGLINKSRASEVRRYMSEFQTGLHYNECNAILEAQELWRGVSTDPDLVTLNDYIEEEYNSPFIEEARQMYEQLREDEMESMRSNPGAYSGNKVKLLLEMGIYSERELLDGEVVTRRVLDHLYNPPMLDSIEQVDVPSPDTGHNATDVFLFGIPSSGKTCVLTGLLGAGEFIYDHSSGGGDYADQLKMYRDNGKAPGRTYGNFVARIGGVITDNSGPGETVRYPINLIEMSGEEFATRIVYNKDREIDLESMGTGATVMLTSSNRKVIFIVIDPSADGLIKLATQHDDGSSETRTVQQDIVINKIVDMLARNPKVLKNTNAIHFIMTKADTLGNREERNEIAGERLKKLYSHAIANLKQMGRQYSFNATSDYGPMVFTFSLGRFYVGDYYDYDPTDSDLIINVLKSLTQSERKRGFFDTIKASVN